MNFDSENEPVISCFNGDDLSGVQVDGDKKVHSKHIHTIARSKFEHKLQNNKFITVNL